MIKKISYILFVFLFSCKSLSVPKSITQGTFRNVGKDYSYSLILNKDSTFALKLQNLDVINMCNGKWHYKDKNTIQTICDSANTMEILSSGYMFEREKQIYVINKNKIKIDQVILKRDDN